MKQAITDNRFLAGMYGRFAGFVLSLFLALCATGCSDDVRKGDSAPTAGGGSAVAAADARFNRPSGIAADAAGNLYVADTGNFVVRKISHVGIVTTIAGRHGEKGSADGEGSTARFEQPTALTLDAAGYLYVVDANAIRRISPGGDVVTFAGSALEMGLADRSGPAALFSRPEGISADAEGNLYIADSGNRAIRKIAPAGNVSTVIQIDQEPIHSLSLHQDRLYVGGESCLWRVEIGSGGSSALARMGGEIGAYGNVDGPGGIMRFWPVVGVASDQAGNVYALQSFARARGMHPHGAVRKLTPSEDGLRFVASTMAGDPDRAGSADGIGTAALFNQPRALAIDASGNLYVADSGNHSIRKVSAAGLVTTIAGRAGEDGIK
jgi:sugar lactone lactonase YvrE